ncbi:MAG TPA: S16 family serine protease [Candidatus Nanopelagicales bacterium]|nr:S16 family serine protease [Candidatus Nanopelagicales bacterium]
MTLASRRRAWLVAAAVLGGVLLVVGVLVPLPYVELSPGPTYNTLGEADGKPIIAIEDTTTYPTSGNLDLTTVNERGGPGHPVYLGRVIVGWADPSVRVVPREAFYPDDLDPEDVAAQNTQMFSDSESDAIAAALHYLHRPVITLTIVSQVMGGGPSDGKLSAGDVLLAIDGVVVREPTTVTDELKKVAPGSTVVVKVRPQAGGAPRDVSIVTGHAPGDPNRAYLGIGVGTTYKAPFPISVQLGGVGGPSAGTMLSLGIVDKLTPGELNGGRFVAGTGTITPDGEVGPIGGIEQKMIGARRAGATLFLAPESNCSDVTAGGVPDGLTVAKVSTLAGAVSAIEDYVAGRPVTGCSS